MNGEGFEVFDARLKAPFSLIVAGPSNCGKTTFVYELLINQERLVTTNFDYTLWFYGEQPPEAKISQQLKNLKTIEGLPDSFNNYIQAGQHGVAVFDDLMSECSNNSLITDFFTKRSHHQNVSIIFITQNLYHGGKERINFTKNATYLTIFNSPLDQTLPYTLGRKLMPKNQKTFIQLYNHAVDKPHGYLFIDGHQETPKNAMFRTSIFGDTQRVLIPIKK